MSIYVDTPMLNGGIFDGYCHMWSSDGNLDELNAFAAEIGLKSEWLQSANKRFIHYDLSPSKRKKALLLGATYKPLQTWIIENK